MSNASDFFTTGNPGNPILDRLRMDLVEVNNIRLKDSPSSSVTEDSSTFWTKLIGLEKLSCEAEFITTLQDTSEQTIVDMTGSSGVLTGVIAPRLSSVGDITTIRVTADGFLYTYIFPASEINPANGGRHCLGFFPAYKQVAATSGTGSGVLSAFDVSFGDPLTREVGMSLPANALAQGYGIPYTGSIKVTVQMSAPANATSNGLRAATIRMGYLYKERLS